MSFSISAATRQLLIFGKFRGVGAAALNEIARTASATNDLHAAAASIPVLANALDDRDALGRAVRQADREITTAEEHELVVLSPLDEAFPPALRQVFDRPPILFVKGSLAALSRPAVGIIGTREPTPDGLTTATAIAADFATSGWAVLSGLALGIDGAAHQAAVNARGITIAVLAHGLDMISPSRHRDLAEEILATGGAWVSEYAPGVRPFASQFIKRDRVQAGMSLGVILIQTGRSGGSLHASRACLEYSRPLAYPLPTRRDTENREPKVEGIVFIHGGSRQSVSEYLRCTVERLRLVRALRSPIDYAPFLEQMLREGGDTTEIPIVDSDRTRASQASTSTGASLSVSSVTRTMNTRDDWEWRPNGSAEGSSGRNILFISHANPEDNEFAEWLALRLAAEGFPVWCDVVDLLGGETFWSDVEKLIRERAAKVIFIVSKHSSVKGGTLQELGLAKSVQRAEKITDFVIPIGIDDLAPMDYNIQLNQVNVLRFQDGWHLGLDRLIEKLRKDRVSSDPRFGPAEVASWWRQRMSGQRLLLREPEALATNLYALKPFTLYVHRLTTSLINAPIELPGALPPSVRHGDSLVCLSPADDVSACLGTGTAVFETRSFAIGLPGAPRPNWSYRDERAILTKLLNQVWQRMLQEKNLPTHQFSTGAPAFYFQHGMVPDDWLSLTEPDGSRANRQVVGTSKRGESVRYWHFALGARPIAFPTVGYVMRPHVLLSDDGRNIWESPERLARARVSICRNWWNDRWRDLTLASVQYLSGGDPVLRLPAGVQHLELNTQPLEVECPVSYDEAELERDDDIEVAVDHDYLDESEPDSDEEE